MADKKLNTVADETINTDKRQDITAANELNAAANKTINADKRQNATFEPLIVIKN